MCKYSCVDELFEEARDWIFSRTRQEFEALRSAH